MKSETVWKLSLVLWCITLIVSIVGVGLWAHKYFTGEHVRWFPLFMFAAAAFSSVMWICIYRREIGKKTKK